jgi:SAM-dependent methyltransferase
MLFDRYAQHYDNLYRDKDYAVECDFVEGLFRMHAPLGVRDVIDLGCGTGGHALPLFQRGYQITAVDRSPEMLALARKKAGPSGVPIEFICADLRSLELGRTFDAVIAMFAVVSYQTNLIDLLATFSTARRHLSPGGLFVFDAWFGPAVLLNPPQERSKTVAGQAGEEIVRSARPTLDLLAQTVRVDYSLEQRRGNVVLDTVVESHLLRFLFPGEVELLARSSGFELIQVCPFLEPSRAPSSHDWNVSWVLRAL